MTQQQNPSPAMNLITLRIAWAAMMMGLLVFLGVVLFLTRGEQPPPDVGTMRMLFIVLLAMMLVGIPAGMLIRATAYRSGRQPDGTVSMPAYSAGNLVFFAICEGVGFFGLVCTLLNGAPGPHTVPALTAIAILLVSYPNGRPLRASAP